MDRAHVLASAAMDRHAAYVALTRHRDGVALHYGRDVFADGRALGRVLGQERAKDTTLDYAGAEPLAAFAERRGFDPLRPDSAIVVRPQSRQAERQAAPPTSSRLPARAEPVPAAVPASPEPLLPAFQDAWGRDSLGRGVTAAELAAAGDADPQVRRAAQERAHWIGAAYRDPEAARARLAAMLAAAGGDLRRAAAQLAKEGPGALGRLKGRNGLLAGRWAKLDRAGAERDARGVGRSLVEEATQRERAAAAWRDTVAAQRRWDAVVVPGLSVAAWRTLEGVARARAGADGRAQPGEGLEVGEARRDARVAVVWARAARSGVAEEVGRFLAAARARLGEAGMRGAMQAASVGRAAAVPGATPEQAADLVRLARGVSLGQEGMTRQQAHGVRVQQRQEQRRRAMLQQAREAARQRIRPAQPRPGEQQHQVREQQRPQQQPRQGPRMGR